MLYTRKGDDGTSTLLDTTKRLRKSQLVFSALGTIDETNCWLGWCRARAMFINSDISNQLLKEQKSLFVIQAELAGTSKSITKKSLIELETDIEFWEQGLLPVQNFIIPGEDELSAILDLARTVCRRAERVVIDADNEVKISTESLAYLNRLSSLLYALARFTALKVGVEEKYPSY